MAEEAFAECIARMDDPTLVAPTATMTPNMEDKSDLVSLQNRYIRAWRGVGSASDTNVFRAPTLIPLKDFVENARPTFGKKDDSGRCDTCGFEACSKADLEIHLAGKPHKRRKKMADLDQKLAEKFRGLSMLWDVSVGKWKCTACNVELASSSVEPHMKGRSHQKAMRYFIANMLGDTGRSSNGSNSSTARPMEVEKENVPSSARLAIRQEHKRGGTK